MHYEFALNPYDKHVVNREHAALFVLDYQKNIKLNFEIPTLVSFRPEADIVARSESLGVIRHYLCFR